MNITSILCPNIIGLLCLFILLLFTRSNYYLEKNKLRLFNIAALINMLIILLEVADYALSVSIIKNAYIFRRITTASAFALTPVFAMVICSVPKKEKQGKWWYIPAAINVILSYASCFSGHMFYISSENIYSRGALFYVMIIICCFYLALLILNSFSKTQGTRKNENLFLISIVFIIILCNYLEIIHAFFFLTWNCCAMLLLSYYLYLHLQYFKLDPLTKVYNRNMFNSEINALHRCSNVGILSFDLNGLKAVNDKYGHEKGDEYIIISSRLINKCFLDYGSLFRIGGDEFVVIMKNTSEAIIQNAIKAFEDEMKKGEVSIACGYCFYPRVTDVQQMLRIADEAMYENKRDWLNNR